MAEELAQTRSSLTEELGEARQEILRHGEALQTVREQTGNQEGGEDLHQQIHQMEQQQASLEQERAVLESELESVRNRAVEASESLAEQKRQATEQQTQWADELKHMRRLMEEMSTQLAEGRTAAVAAPQVSAEPVAVGVPSNVGDPVLDSVMAQFEMLQKDLARRRAGNAK